MSTGGIDHARSHCTPMPKGRLAKPSCLPRPAVGATTWGGGAATHLPSNPLAATNSTPIRHQETSEDLRLIAVSPYAVTMRETGLEPAPPYGDWALIPEQIT